MEGIALYLIIVGPAFLLALYAQYKVKSTFSHYSQIPNSRGLSGAEVAQAILDGNNIHDVSIEPVEGFLSDHYDPSGKVLRLSPEVYEGRSQSAVGVAAHEVGHAIQHATNYHWLGMRSALVPVVMFGSNLWIPCFILAGALASVKLFLLGVVIFGLVAVFQLVTLPVEFDASRRALVEVERLGIMGGRELDGARSVLNAAALTYVAAAIQTIATILYYLILLNTRNRE